MLKTLLLLLAVSLQGPPGPQPELGIIAGVIAPSTEEQPPESVRVVLLSPQYATLWVSDVQKRLDMYWERYKPAFAQKKEFFFEVSRMAYRDSLEFVVNRMQRDTRIQITNFVQTARLRTESSNSRTSLWANTEIVALGKVGGEDMLWQESVDVTGSVPQFIRLKKIVP